MQLKKIVNVSIGFGLVVLCGPAMGRISESVPKGLQSVDWKQIRAEYERHRHAAFADATGFQARNFGQQWMTRFDGRGVTVEPEGAGWRWGLELTGVRGKARVSTDVNRVTYRWGADLEEWFVNEPRGLEHGFTLNAPRQIRLAVRGGLEARASADGIEFVNASGAARMTYKALEAWDASGRRLPARMRVVERQIVFNIDDRGAKYPVRLDPIAQQAYLKASNTDAGDEFGFSVAISGDTVVVGALGESSNATGVNGNQGDNSSIHAGAAYVFVRSGTMWSQQAYLKASNTDANDQFGFSVAVSGDTVVVGATGEDSNATGVNGNQSDNSAEGSGAAYVFVRSGTVWSQQAYLKASNTDPGDEFGYSVAVSGDTVVVAAILEGSNATGVNANQSDNSATNSGAAYVFVRSGTVWSQQAYLKASNTGNNDEFGYSVAVSADTVVVGALGESSNATGVNGNQGDDSAGRSGAAYVFVRSGTAWSQQAYLKASNTGANDRFGVSVAVSGDTVVVGAPGESSNATGVNGNQGDNSALGSGAAYVFVRSGTTWSQQAYLKASNTGANDEFGFFVAVSGDTVVVAAAAESSNATGVNGNQGDNSAAVSGAAYVFVRSGTAWSQQAYLKASNTGANDIFGQSVAVSGDTVVVGAVFEDSNATGVNGNQSDNSATNSGAAYTFLITPVTVNVTVNSSPSGLVFSSSGGGCAAGSNYTTPQVLSWTPGSSCTLTFSSPQTVGITQYAFSHWEDNSTNSSRSITAPSTVATYTATFLTAPDLTITKTHSMTFSQGQTGAAYTIGVSNVSGGPTDGSTVTVDDMLPAGMTATSFSGAGWSCSSIPLRCTRNDVLASSMSYPDLTLAVSIASNASTSATNTATVSGGGDLNADNNRASDLATINAITNVSAQLQVTQNGFGRNRGTGLWTATLTVTNTSGATIAGPIQEVFTNLSSNATMTNNTGMRNGSPYLTISTGALAPGASVSVSIQFTNPTNGFIQFTPVSNSGIF